MIGTSEGRKSQAGRYTEAVQNLPIAGELAQEFELPDSTGVLRRLSVLVSHGRLVLLFYRGNW